MVTGLFLEPSKPLAGLFMNFCTVQHSMQLSVCVCFIKHVEQVDMQLSYSSTNSHGGAEVFIPPIGLLVSTDIPVSTRFPRAAVTSVPEFITTAEKRK